MSGDACFVAFLLSMFAWSATARLRRVQPRGGAVCRGHHSASDTAFAQCLVDSRVARPTAFAVLPIHIPRSPVSIDAKHTRQHAGVLDGSAECNTIHDDAGGRASTAYGPRSIHLTSPECHSSIPLPRHWRAEDCFAPLLAPSPGTLVRPFPAALRPSSTPRPAPIPAATIRLV